MMAEQNMQEFIEVLSSKAQYRVRRRMCICGGSRYGTWRNGCQSDNRQEKVAAVQEEIRRTLIKGGTAF